MFVSSLVLSLVFVECFYRCYVVVIFSNQTDVGIRSLLLDLAPQGVRSPSVLNFLPKFIWTLFITGRFLEASSGSWSSQPEREREKGWKEGSSFYSRARVYTMMFARFYDFFISINQQEEF